MEDELEELLDRRRRSALSLDDFSLLGEIDSVLRGFLKNEEVNSAMDQIRDRVLGRRHPATISDLHSRIKNSTICPGHTLVLPKGNITNPRAVFVAYTLDRDTVASLSECLKQLGFSSQNVALTSLVRCSFDHPITDDDVADMLPYFWEELKIWRPRVIVPLGSNCTKVLFGEGFRITAEHGQPIWLDDYCFIPTYAPPGTSQEQRKRKEEFMDDLKSVKPYTD